RIASLREVFFASRVCMCNSAPAEQTPWPDVRALRALARTIRTRSNSESSARAVLSLIAYFRFKANRANTNSFGPSQASGSSIRIGTSRGLGGKRSEGEFCHEEVVLDHGPAKCRRVVRDPSLQQIEPRFGIEQRDAHRDLAQVRSAEEAERGLLEVVD